MTALLVSLFTIVLAKSIDADNQSTLTRSKHCRDLGSIATVFSRALNILLVPF